MLDTLHRYNREYGMTIVMISSELEELRSICDRIAIVDEGRVAGILPPERRDGGVRPADVGRASQCAQEAHGA